jgi:hypothetical protein
MIYCQCCSQALPDGTLFCDRCDTARLGPAPPRPYPAPQADPAGHLTMVPPSVAEPAAHLTMVPPPLAEPGGTPPMEEPPAAHDPEPPDTGVVAVPRPARRDGRPPAVRLRMTNGAAYVLRGKSAYIIGRRDAHTGFLPDVDLSKWNGAECGVSRRHATLHVTPEGVFIEDLESKNQTIRNGYRLLPRQRYPLADGDELRLGTLTLLVDIA